MTGCHGFFFFFFFNDTATTEIYTLSLHDALPISAAARRRPRGPAMRRAATCDNPSAPATRQRSRRPPPDRKSTRLNSSHSQISYAVFCLKKKKQTIHLTLAIDPLRRRHILTSIYL